MPDRDNVIRFPSWRREAVGAPGVPAGDPGAVGVPDAPPGEGPAPTGGAQADEARQAWLSRPRTGEVNGLDRPVWHEGVTTTNDGLVQFRVDILGTRPPIWRRLVCRSSVTLDLLHPVLAAAFGWPRDTEYRFRDVIRWEGATRVGPSFRNQWTGARAGAPEEWAVPLGRVLDEPRARLRYDHGRNGGWRCTIVAEDVMPMPPAAAGEVPAVRCIGGRRADPPEQFSSVGMYDLVLRERADRLDGPAPHDSASWSAAFDVRLPDGFDPAAFDLERADRHVRAALAYPTGHGESDS